VHLGLGADLEQAWNHENVTTAMRKHILRAVLVEIIVTVSAERIDLLLHWQGGDHTQLSVRRRKSRQHVSRWVRRPVRGSLPWTKWTSCRLASRAFLTATPVHILAPLTRQVAARSQIWHIELRVDAGVLALMSFFTKSTSVFYATCY